MGWVLSGTIIKKKILDPGDPLGLGSVGNNSRPRRSLGVGVSGRVTDLGLGDLLGVRLAQVPHRHDVVVSVIHHHQLVPSILYVTKKNTDYFSSQRDSIMKITRILVIFKKRSDTIIDSQNRFVFEVCL